MSEYPYGMIVMAVVGILSAFLYAREPSTVPVDAGVQVAQTSTAVPQQQFPAQAWPVPQQPVVPAQAGAAPSTIPMVMPKGYVPPPPATVTAPPMMGVPPVQRAMPTVPPAQNK